MQLTVPSFEFPRDVIPPSVHFVGTPPLIPNQAPLPPWSHELDGSRKVVLVTQGTVANHDFGLLIAPTLAALANEPDVLVVVTAGGRAVEAIPGAIPCQCAACKLFAVRVAVAEGRRVRHQWRLWQRQPGHELWHSARHGRVDGRQGRRQCARRMVRRRHRSRNQRTDAGSTPRSDPRRARPPGYRLRASQMAAEYAAIDTRSEILGIIDQVAVNELTRIVVQRRGTMVATRGRRAAR